MEWIWDETLQPEVSPSEWIHTAPIQDLLARGDPSPEPAADAKGPTALQPKWLQRTLVVWGGPLYTCMPLLTRMLKISFEKEQCLLSQRYDAIWQ